MYPTIVALTPEAVWRVTVGSQSQFASCVRRSCENVEEATVRTTNRANPNQLRMVSSFHSPRRHRQLIQPHAGRVEDGVRDDGAHGHDRALAAALGWHTVVFGSGRVDAVVGGG